MTAPKTFKGFGIDSPKNWTKPTLVEYERKQINPKDVVVKIECCGVCGSDLHTVQGNWGGLNRKDLVVGHEIVGKVVEVGKDVSEFKVGQRVGIGANSSSCLDCKRCNNGNEQYCEQAADTYNAPDVRSNDYVTQGGYASHAIAQDKFVFALPDEIASEHAGPLMCAGLTVFSPIVRNVGYDLKGKTVGVLGIGGLGHLAIQFANALGAKVVVFSRTSSKKEDALKLGGHEFVATSEDKDWAKKLSGKLDFILSCASGIDMDLADYFKTLDVNCKLVTVGMPTANDDFAFDALTFIGVGGYFGSSHLGNKEEMMKLLDVAAKHSVKPWIEKIPISEAGVSEALTKLDKGDVRYRTVLVDFDKAFD